MDAVLPARLRTRTSGTWKRSARRRSAFTTRSISFSLSDVPQGKRDAAHADGGIIHLAFVPSLRSGLVKDLAVRLADACGLQLLDVLIKSAAPPQKEQQNSAHQCRNAYTSFGIAAEACIPYHILLIDDIVDSGWTLTACGQLLRERGALSVTPFALADSSEREGS